MDSFSKGCLFLYLQALTGNGMAEPGLAGAFWAQTEQHSGCGAASPSQGHRDPDSLRRRLVWAGKPQLGNAAWGASFPSERALPAGGFGSVHTPSP